MINLARAELDRLRSRRVVIIWLIVLFVALAGFQVIVAISVRQPSATELANARQQFQQAQTEYKNHHDADVKQCQQDNPGQADQCDYPAPTWNQYKPRPASFTEMGQSTVTITIVLTALTFLLIGASSIGAEYSSGAIANWMSFVPDRMRVFTSKLGVVVCFAAVAGAVAAALTLISTVVLVKINSGPVTRLGDQLARGGRGLIVVVVATVIAFALALISRHTIAALGAVIGYVVVDFVLNLVMQSVESLQKIKSWLPENNAAAVINHGLQYYDQVQRVTVQGTEIDSIPRHLSFVHGLTYLLALLVVATVASLVVFRRRDIT